MSTHSFTKMGMLFWLLVAVASPHAVDAHWLRNLIKQFSDVGTIVKFRLIDADTDLPIMDITNDQVIILPLTNATNFNIDVVTANGPVGAIRFGYLGNGRYNIESRPPYSLCTDDWRTGDYKPCPKFAAGRHEITATPYNRAFALGQAGEKVTVSFTVLTEVPLPPSAPVKPSTSAPRISPTRAPQLPTTPDLPSAPQRLPVAAPQRIQVPTGPIPVAKAPVKSPTVPAPIKNPAMAAPIKNPAMAAPIKAITSAPKMPPVNTPQRVPKKTPIKLPVSAPTTKVCRIPKFIDTSWQLAGPQYPIPRFGEPQGLLIGNDMVIFSGFINSFANATNQTYARDVSNSSSAWRRMDDMPLLAGVTHAATLAIGTKVYLCGGYVGGHPGPHTPFCFVYDHSIPPGRRRQWTRFYRLPNGGSSGGGMIYDSALNTLFFAGGGQRRVPGSPHPVDINNTWKISLSKPASGWVASTPFPYLANHLSYVTHTDDRGTERHFFLGGQVGENECCTNFGLNYEFIASSETWVKRASMPIPRGHASSSTRAIGCGFIVAGGAINSGSTKRARTDDISYYDIPTDTWTIEIGKLPKETVTPIVDIDKDGYMHYITGLPNQSRRRISVA